MTPTEQKFYPIELFAPTVLKSNSPNEGPGSGMDIRNSFGDVFTHIHRQTYGHIDPLGKDRKFFNLFLGYISCKKFIEIFLIPKGLINYGCHGFYFSERPQDRFIFKPH